VVAPPLKIFINYRHEDTQGIAWALCFKLEDRFGVENVFFDNGSLRPGTQWLEEIKLQCAGAAVFLSVVGQQWKKNLIAHMKPGEVDYVAKEIDLAFRAGPQTTVIPVLIDDTELPAVCDLPHALKALPTCQVERLRHSHLRSDIEHLIERLGEIRDSQPGAGPDVYPAGARAVSR
jgi:hypothetical protein